jgi:NAD(P)-dependent dehydrogenase (short-subunit alcohol dehydrogenase family)
MMRLEGRVALISGVATGIGRSGALLFAKEGAAVVGLDMNEAGGMDTVRAIEATGGRAVLSHGDVSQGSDMRAAVDLAVSRFGKLDLLWANAGIGVFKDIVETTDEDWDRIVGVNLKGAYLMAHHGIPEVIRSGGGTMVMTASTSAFVGSKRWAAYCATKGGVLMLCRAMALDYAEHNVRINCVAPGAIDTPLLETEKQMFGMTYEQGKAEDARSHPLGRVGRPDEVARAALFLSCDESSFTTGSSVFVDGGYTAV